MPRQGCLQVSDFCAGQLLVADFERPFAALADELEPGAIAVIASSFQLQTSLLHEQQRNDVTQLLLRRVCVFEHPLEVPQQRIRIERFWFLGLQLRHGASPMSDHPPRWTLPAFLRKVEADRLPVLLDEDRMDDTSRLERRLRGGTRLADGFEATIQSPDWGMATNQTSPSE